MLLFWAILVSTIITLVVPIERQLALTPLTAGVTILAIWTCIGDNVLGYIVLIIAVIYFLALGYICCNR